MLPKRSVSELVQKRTYGMPAAGVGGVNIAIRTRVVELLVLGLHQEVVGAGAPVVDAWLRDGKTVSDDTSGTSWTKKCQGTAGGDLVHRRHASPRSRAYT